MSYVEGETSSTSALSNCIGYILPCTCL